MQVIRSSQQGVQDLKIYLYYTDANYAIITGLHTHTLKYTYSFLDSVIIV